MTPYDQARLRAEIAQDHVRAIWMDRIVFGVCAFAAFITWWLS